MAEGKKRLLGDGDLDTLVELLTQRLGGGLGSLQSVGGNAQNPLIGQFRTPLPGFQVPTSTQPYFGPGGPNLNFTGGSPFPVNERPANIVTSLVLAASVARALQARNKALKGQKNTGDDSLISGE